MTNSRIYNIFHGMRQRCNNKNCSAYKNYGAKGIKVCPEWDSAMGFRSFYKWSIENGYQDNLTIDRIDNSKGYSPDNCRWITNSEQQRNKTNNVKVEFDGEEMFFPDISEKTGLNEKTLRERYKRKGCIDTSEPKHRTVLYKGKKVGLRELSKLTGINYDTLQTRMTLGYNDEQIITGYMATIKKHVIQYDKLGNEIARFSGAREAARRTGIYPSGIISVCIGKRKSAGGYIWRYSNEM